MFKRSPDFVIGQPDNPYMLRWWIIPRNRWFNIYLHKILRSDDDRALHDHPWWSLSIILKGKYTEVTPPDFGTSYTRRLWKRFSIIYRSSTYKHRLEVEDKEPVWTLFFTGRTVRTWGFWCPKGFVPWFDFVDARDKGNIGRGCGEME